MTATGDSRTASIARLYDRLGPAYHRWWAPVIEPAGLRLLDLVADAVTGRPDALIVDVGAGTGPLARAAAARWPSVRATAIDPSDGMLGLGRDEAARTLDPRVRRRISWQPGVAERLPVADGAADAVVSSFVLQYLGNRLVALREAYRVLRPGGTLAVVTWLVNDWSFTPWRLFDELLGELGIARPPSEEVGVFRSLPSAAAIVRRAGFRGVRATEGLVAYQWTLDRFLHCALESEELELFESLDDATRDRLERTWRERLELLPEADLRYRDRVAYVTGRRPG